MAYESVLAAEGSDWCWWYGPEHSSAYDAEFDALYRRHLTQIYVALGAEAPATLLQPIKRKPERAFVVAPSAYLSVQVNGRESSYFEWLGAGLYSADRQSGALHGRSYFLHELHYGFDEGNLYVRVDSFPKALLELRECELRLTLRATEELRVTARLEQGRLVGWDVTRNDVRVSRRREKVSVAFDQILEVRVARGLLNLGQQASLPISVALWRGGLPVDVLPAEGWLEVKLGADDFAWPRG